MKKLVSILLLVVLIFSISSCKEKEYAMGEIVKKDGLEYEFYSGDYLYYGDFYGPNHDKQTVNFENEKNLTINVYYPFDLVHYENYENLDLGVVGESNQYIINALGPEATKSRFMFISRFVMFNDMPYLPYYEYCHDYRTEVDKKSFFIVRGLAKEHSDIVIPTEIDNIPVLGIGNYAFANAKLNSVTVEGPEKNIGNWRFCVFPYAFSNVEVENVIIDRPSAIYPRAFDQTKINQELYLTKTSILDAGIYESTINKLEIDYYNNIISGDAGTRINMHGNSIYGVGYINPPILNSTIKQFAYKNNNIKIKEGITSLDDLNTRKSDQGHWGTEDVFISQIEYVWDQLYYYLNPEIVFIDGNYYLKMIDCPLGSDAYVLRPLMFNKDQKYESLYYSFMTNYNFKDEEKLETEEGYNHFYPRRLIFDNYIHDYELDAYVFRTENLTNVDKVVINLPEYYSSYDYKADIKYENETLYINNLYQFDDEGNDYYTKIFSKPEHLELVITNLQ